MGACIAKEKQTINVKYKKILIKKKKQVQRVIKANNFERMISCSILQNGKKIKQNFNSGSTVNEVKRMIKKNCSINEENDKLINLYHDGKELKEGEEKIGNICKNNDTLDLVMVSITLNESSSILNSENKMNEKIINKLVYDCKYHKGGKDKYFCINCGMAFCDQCKDKHNNHKTVEKKEIIKYIKDLNEKKKIYLILYKK